MTESSMNHEATHHTEQEPDYPASTLSLRFELSGVSVSWTLRGDDNDVASRLPRILDYLRRLQAKLPKPMDLSPEPAPDVIRGQAESRPAPAPPLEDREDWCSLHGVAMLRQENARGAWWSHKTLEGWCKGKPKRAGDRAS